MAIVKENSPPPVRDRMAQRNVAHFLCKKSADFFACSLRSGRFSDSQKHCFWIQKPELFGSQNFPR